MLKKEKNERCSYIITWNTFYFQNNPDVILLGVTSNRKQGPALQVNNCSAMLQDILLIMKKYVILVVNSVKLSFTQHAWCDGAQNLLKHILVLKCLKSDEFPFLSQILINCFWNRSRETEHSGKVGVISCPPPKNKAPQVEVQDVLTTISTNKHTTFCAGEFNCN